MFKGVLSHVRRQPVAFVALFVALAGTSIAATQLPKNSVGTKQLKNGAVTTKKIRNRAVTASKIKTAGLTVPNATNAANAANAAALGGLPPSAYQQRVQWALIRSDGTILAQSGGITVESPAGGSYYLDFGTSVASRPVSVTLHWLDPDQTGEVSAAPCGGSAVTGGVGCEATGTNDANHLYVETHSSSGTSAPMGFWVTVGR